MAGSNIKKMIALQGMAVKNYFKVFIFWFESKEFFFTNVDFLLFVQLFGYFQYKMH